MKSLRAHVRKHVPIDLVQDKPVLCLCRSGGVRWKLEHAWMQNQLPVENQQQPWQRCNGPLTEIDTCKKHTAVHSVPTSKCNGLNYVVSRLRFTRNTSHLRTTHSCDPRTTHTFRRE